MMKLDFSVESSSQPVSVKQAILLYGTTPNPNGFNESHLHGTVYASIHSVGLVGSGKNKKMSILTGEAISQESLIQALGSLAEKYVLNAELLPETVLSFSPMHMVWWVPAAKRRVFFRCKELGGKRSAVVPHPPLLFVAYKGSWSVLALAENKRPTKETKLYHAPYFNVYDDHRICTGTADIPDQLSTGLIPQWEAAFFDSEFTHINGSVKKAKHPRGEYALWKELLEGMYKEFPLEYLVDAKATVGGLMNTLKNRMGG